MCSPRFACLVIAATLALLSACDGDPCAAASLQGELDRAAASSVVVAGSCVIEGSLEVPAGVTLRGSEGTVLRGTVLSGVGVPTVTLAEGAALEGLTVRAERGTAVLVEAGGVRLADVVIQGPVDADSADTLPPVPTASETATHGLVIRGAGREDAPVELTDVTVGGFGRFGALFVDSHVRWAGGGAEENLGVGLMVSGGTATLLDVVAGATFRGVSPYGYGAVFRDGAAVHTEGLELSDNGGAGALLDDVASEHLGLSARGNGDAGLWVQRSAAFTLEGAALEDNALGGLVAFETPSFVVRQTTLSRARLATRIVDGRAVEVGDGLHFVASTGSALTLDRVTSTDNPRVGILVQLGDGALSAASLDAVVVEASGDALGAVAQTTTEVLPADAFGAGLERRGAALTNDASVTERVNPLGVVAPMFLPPPMM